jgi:peroxiredoxin
MKLGLLLVAGVTWGQVFVPAPQEPVATLRFGAELPAFEVKDVLGRTWRSEDLRGKYTLVYLWHTFAAGATDRLDGYTLERLRMLPDLREVERVYQDAKKSASVQVLTFCTDYDYMHAHDFMKERQYNFPVIADWALAKKLFDGRATQWVVSPDGRLSEPVRGWSFSRLLWEAQRAAAGLR